jgi:hypothetical protein
VGYMKVSKVFCRAKNSNLGYQLKGRSCYITEVSIRTQALKTVKACLV